jgi:hypothetical protein
MPVHAPVCRVYKEDSIDNLNPIYLDFCHDLIKLEERAEGYAWTSVGVPFLGICLRAPNSKF